jgi:hypothetical protein
VFFHPGLYEWAVDVLPVVVELFMGYVGTLLEVGDTCEGLALVGHDGDSEDSELRTRVGSSYGYRCLDGGLF